VMLLVALMRAKDLAADPVLINSGNSYTLPGAAPQARRQEGGRGSQGAGARK
jgi:hypothetical protein